MIITHEVKIDLKRPGMEQRIHTVQDDKYSRNLEITLTAGGVGWEFPADATALIRYRKSDGTGGTYDTLPDGTKAWSAEGHVLTVALAPQVLTVSGPVTFGVTIIQGVTEISTFAVKIQVHPNVNAQIADSENYSYVTGLLVAPATAAVGQYFRVSAIDDNGHVTAVEAVDAPEGGEADPAEVQKIVEEYLEDNPPAAGADGADGVSPIVELSEFVGDTGEEGVEIKVTDSDGTSVARVRNGSDGADGKSAYELAAEGGYEGTVTDWLASLKGEPGGKGDKGDPGADGKDGYLCVTRAQYAALTAEELAQHYADGVRLVIVEDGYTNLVPLSTDANGVVFYGCGYLNEYRLTSSNGIEAKEYAVITGYMPYTHGETIRIVGYANAEAISAGGQYVAVYGADYSVIEVAYPSSLISSGAATWTVRDDGFCELSVDTSKVSAWADAKYFRVSCVYCMGADLIVTSGEEIGVEV